MNIQINLPFLTYVEKKSNFKLVTRNDTHLNNKARRSTSILTFYTILCSQDCIKQMAKAFLRILIVYDKQERQKQLILKTGLAIFTSTITAYIR